ncbi:type II toxin-antitoxin system Phd/YefM family antitoxin [bacterium]|nr:MAG: type II toxin-antitoxin system Phd/YefM family antitoxin [bacterium]
MIQVNIHHAKTHLSRLIQKVIEGEEVVIAKGNKPIVKLTQILNTPPNRKLGSAQGMIHLSDDFNEPLDDFTEYMN